MLSLLNGFSLKVRIIIVAVVAVGFFAFSKYLDSQNATFVKDPHVGDVYTVHLSSFVSEGVKSTFPYGVLRVESLGDGEVVFNIASAAYGNVKSVNKSLRSDGKKADFYSGELVHFPIAKLAGLLEKGDIVSVDR